MGRLPSSVYEAGFHLSSHYTSRLTVLLSAGKGSAVRWLMQRAAMADAMRCVGRCSVLRFLPHYCASRVAGWPSLPCMPFQAKELCDGKHRTALSVLTGNAGFKVM